MKFVISARTDRLLRNAGKICVEDVFDFLLKNSIKAGKLLLSCFFSFVTISPKMHKILEN